MSTIYIGTDKLSACRGELLAEVLIRAGYPLLRPCGGRGTCGKCLVMVEGEEVLACQYRVYGDIRVGLPEKKDIVSVTGVSESGTETAHLSLALDIGTTTLAMALVSLDEGKVVRTVTRVNPQTSYGADVISRIGYCMKHGTADLQRVLIGEINDMIRSLCPKRIPILYAAGNTTMLHLFLGIECSSIGKAPYTPAFLESKTCTAASLGIEGADTVITLPGAAAFVGADIVAGVSHIGLPDDDKYRLLIDLGTNAEIVLFDRTHALCTAAAAGPCFEGANISCGMSATEGAICRCVGDDPLLFETIGGKKACGICGTGLIDVIAALLENGTLDESGYLEDERVMLAEDVYLTRADVRQYQLAKAAVSAAVETLLETAGVSAEDIDKVCLSGGFAAQINIRSAVRTGLLPASLSSKCVSMGNTSLLGVIDCVLGKNDADMIGRSMKYIDLAASAAFVKRFTENMMFE